MEYSGANLIFKNIIDFIAQNKFYSSIVWIFIMAFLLWKLSKKDNDIYLKKKSDKNIKN